MLDCQCVHALAHSYVSDAVRLHVPEVTLDETLEKKDEFSEAVHVQWPRTWSFMSSRYTSSIVTELKPDVFV